MSVRQRSVPRHCFHHCFVQKQIAYKDTANVLLDRYTLTYVSRSDRLASFASLATGVTTAYLYSAGGQVTKVGTTNFTYDVNGNRNSTGYVTGSFNRVLEDASYTYTYDAEGQRLTRTLKSNGQVERYDWNQNGQLNSVGLYSPSNTISPIKQTSWTYDPLGRQQTVQNISSSLPVGDGASNYLLNDGDFLAEIFDNAGTVQKRFLHGPEVDMVLAEQDFLPSTSALSGPQWQMTDHLQTVRGIAEKGTNATAVRTNAIQYDGFGKITTQTDSTKQPYFGYAGRDTQSLGDLTYNRNRFYDTNLGRFISQDPMSFGAGDANLYRYVGN